MSDRLEKEDEHCQLMMQLECEHLPPVGQIFSDDWTLSLCAALSNDLQKFRAYKGGSVKDLLRAIR